VHDFGCTDGLHWLLMEFVDGVNLRTLMRQGPLTPAQALKIARELCEALQYAHDEGVVHRDIKPENVLIDARGRVKVADFGLAKLIDTGAEAVLTRSDQVMGTPHYMAPEQLERPLEVDHRADLFALGVVLYEMLTGSLPRGKFEPPSHRVQVDVRLDQIVLKALEHEPTRRYQHALEIKTDVDHVTDTRAPEVPGTPDAAPVHGHGPRGRHRTVRDAPERATHGWRVTLPFALAWVLLGLSWNLGAFAFGLGIALVVAVFGFALRERVRAVRAWSEALGRGRRRDRAARPFVLWVGGVLSVGLIAFGHLRHWERGVSTWAPAYPGDAQALFHAWQADPWSLLRLAAPGGRVNELVAAEAQPEVVLERNTSSVPPEAAALPWVLILGGFVLLGVVLAASVLPHEDASLRRRAWALGAELASFGLLALLVLWIGAPIAALRAPQVLQEVLLGWSSELPAGTVLDRLRQRLQDEGLDPVVDQEARVVDRRDARELASATFLRAEASDPFERWSTSFAGAVRESARVYATVCPRLDGRGTVVQLRAGLLDPRRPQYERTRALLDDIERDVEAAAATSVPPGAEPR